MTEPSTSGADLARQALARARAAAKTAPPAKPRGPKRTRRPHAAGRDPQALGGILGNLATDEGWNDNLGGGNILDRWTDLCPTAYTHTTRPVAFDADTGQLTVKATSHTVAAHLRLMERQLVGYINQQIGRPLVRRVRVGVSGDTTPAAPPVEEQPAVETPTTHREKHPGYRAAVEAALTHRPDRQPTNPYVLEARARQEAALRANRQPEEEHREAMWADEPPNRPAPGSSEASRQAALAYKRSEVVGRPLPRVLDVA